MSVLTKKLLTYLAHDPTTSETAKYLTMIGLVDPPPRAASMNFIDESGTIVELASFGLIKKDNFLNRNSIWADLPPFKLLLRGEVSLIDPSHVTEKLNATGFEIEPEPWLRSVLLIPILKKRTPAGAVALFFGQKLERIPELKIDYESFQALMVLAFETPQFQREIINNARPSVPELTDSELECIRFIARGYSNKQIAVETNLALPTVKARVSKLLARFEVMNRKELVQKLRSEKIV